MLNLGGTTRIVTRPLLRDEIFIFTMSIKVNLKGDSKEFESGISVAEIAKSIGAGLYKAACAGKVDGEVVDLRTPLTKDCNLEILTFSEEEGKKAYWHTAAHVLAQAVKRLFPDAKLAIGPAIDNGFYYDQRKFAD